MFWSLLAVVSGKREAGEEALAGKSTLNRLELSTEKTDRYKKIECQTEALDALLVEVFLEAHASVPERIVLDLDVTDLALHGHQEGRCSTAITTATAICRCISSVALDRYRDGTGPAAASVERAAGRAA